MTYVNGWEDWFHVATLAAVGLGFLAIVVETVRRTRIWDAPGISLAVLAGAEVLTRGVRIAVFGWHVSSWWGIGIRCVEVAACVAVVISLVRLGRERGLVTTRSK